MTFPVIPRRSSTLMLAVRSQLANQTASSMGYKLLMLQRSSTSKFMPNAYVFPGGVSETVDFSSEWLELIGARGLHLKSSMINSHFYKSYTELPADSLPAHIGFRICAIRETFEESGVLLVKPLAGSKQVEGNVQKMSDSEMQIWRERVHGDASLFIQLCRDIQCAPDIWSLYEWSNWVTPVYNHSRRYNTMFYFAFLDKEPEMSHDGKEMTSCLWIDPEEALSLCLKKKFNIGPPQFYEMSRICRFCQLDDLKTAVKSIEAVERWDPVSVVTKDGERIVFFPSDALHKAMTSEVHKYCENYIKTMPENMKLIPPKTLPQTACELCTEDQKMNRLVVNTKLWNIRPLCNTTLKYNMPLPVDKCKPSNNTHAKL